MKMKLGMAALLSVGALAVAAGCGDSGSGGAGGTSTSATGSTTTSSSSSKASSGSGTSTASGTSSSTGGAAPTCADFCTTVMMNCTGANADFASNDECMTACMGLQPGMTGDTMGNTIGCHLYHATAAASDPATHCGHADIPATGFCQ